MNKLNAKTRAWWDTLMETEGKRLGLESCCSFLENTHANDISYRGTFKGMPCIVKCSSRAPDSILNEAAMGRRAFAADPGVFPEILACHGGADGRWAIVVTRQVEGPSFYELCRRPDGISPAQAETFAVDVLRMATVLRKTGIVHRDINQKNLLLDQDGHLKLIDFQFAIDRNRYQETAFMRRDWKYLYVVFGLNRELGVGQWNDTPLLIYVLRQLPQTDAVARAIRELEGVSETGLFVAPVPSMIFFRLRLHIWSLRFRLLFHPRGTRAERLRYRLETVREALNFHRREGQNSS